jgi:hypothetical protein
VTIIIGQAPRYLSRFLFVRKSASSCKAAFGAEFAVLLPADRIGLVLWTYSVFARAIVRSLSVSASFSGKLTNKDVQTCGRANSLNTRMCEDAVYLCSNMI